MIQEENMDIDYEKLRKHLVRRSFIRSLFAGTPAYMSNVVNADNATPEQLLNLAKRHGVNLDKYKKK